MIVYITFLYQMDTSLTENLYSLVNALWLALPETILYTPYSPLGVFGVLLVVNVCIVRARGKMSTMRLALVVETGMFLVATVHLGSTLYAIYFGVKIDALHVLQVAGTYVNQGFATLPELAHKRTIAVTVAQVAFVAQVWLGDGFMLFRLWRVWNNDQRVVTPISLGFLADIALGIFALYRNGEAFVDMKDRTTTTIGQHIDDQATMMANTVYISVVAVSLAVHVTCTVLIAARVLFLQRQVGRSVQREGGVSPTAVAILLLESAAIYSLSMLALLIAFAESFIKSLRSRFNYMDVVMGLVVPLVGVTFSIIITRMGLGISVEMFLRKFSIRA
ncbi:hypothetical protein CONPUDRAFT_147543 [Coniophora puteana RWD-64-598 SS2]|uniref:G protein-coupled receptor n=1 Tax=Coniophora puteana (strain RWD-64-598) TaxID=741705 RepID=A0A5M3M806_CONPW|nr:uncharacterized protein CONPUDRAFT_147543 [Coniophora puteana RWD-64-598 SS2]EIW75004.1 hypothetical protein CONPUDRAFT_147543 [Coniophora puteana RWD-64-598 SS2]